MHKTSDYTLYYIILRYITLHYIHYVTLRYITLCYVILRYISYITLHNVMLCYIILYFIILYKRFGRKVIAKLLAKSYLIFFFG